MTLTISWWVIPTLITVLGTVWAIFIYEDSGSMGIGNMLLMVPVSVVSAISWILAALLK